MGTMEARCRNHGDGARLAIFGEEEIRERVSGGMQGHARMRRMKPSHLMGGCDQRDGNDPMTRNPEVAMRLILIIFLPKKVGIALQ
jgi:hypothetical protein